MCLRVHRRPGVNHQSSASVRPRLHPPYTRSLAMTLLYPLPREPSTSPRSPHRRADLRARRTLLRPAQSSHGIAIPLVGGLIGDRECYGNRYPIAVLMAPGDGRRSLTKRAPAKRAILCNRKAADSTSYLTLWCWHPKPPPSRNRWLVAHSGPRGGEGRTGHGKSQGQGNIEMRAFIGS